MTVRKDMIKGTQENKLTLSKKGQLSATQILVAEEIAYKGLTGKTEDQIAQENNVNRSTIWRWKAIPAFNDEINRIVKEYQRSKLVDVNSILNDILENGSEKSKLKAIELFYRNQGYFKDTMEITDKKELSVNVDDLLQELKGM
jgi:hypothetical protein